MLAEQDKVRVTVSVLVLKDDKVLLEKRLHNKGSGTWGPPTGHPDFGETPEQTATRETSEETGVTLADLKFVAVTNDVFESEHYHTVTVWMSGECVAGEPRVLAPDEESEVGWFGWDALPSPLYIPFANFLAGHTYPSRKRLDTVGEAGETMPAPVQPHMGHDAGC